jgi:hypothetical protein
MTGWFKWLLNKSNIHTKVLLTFPLATPALPAASVVMFSLSLIFQPPKKYMKGDYRFMLNHPIIAKTIPLRLNARSHNQYPPLSKQPSACHSFASLAYTFSFPCILITLLFS